MSPVPAGEPGPAGVLPGLPDPRLFVTSTPSIEAHPVLHAIARTAARLCEAGDALIYVIEDDQHRLVAKYGRLPQPQRVGDTLIHVLDTGAPWRMS